MNNVYDALEICLQEIEKGADLETVLELVASVGDASDDGADDALPMVEQCDEAGLEPSLAIKAEAARCRLDRGSRRPPRSPAA